MISSKVNPMKNEAINIGGMRGPFLSLLKKPVVYHSLFWTLYFILNVFRWGGYNQDYLTAFYNNLIEFPMHMGLAYLNIYYLIPRYLPKKVLPIYSINLYWCTDSGWRPYFFGRYI